MPQLVVRFTKTSVLCFSFLQVCKCIFIAILPLALPSSKSARLAYNFNIVSILGTTCTQLILDHWELRVGACYASSAYLITNIVIVKTHEIMWSVGFVWRWEPEQNAWKPRAVRTHQRQPILAGMFHHSLPEQNWPLQWESDQVLPGWLLLRLHPYVHTYNWLFIALLQCACVHCWALLAFHKC